jgi:hypothetical protein
MLTTVTQDIIIERKHVVRPLRGLLVDTNGRNERVAMAVVLTLLVKRGPVRFT